jgi:hypothetical protein
MAVLSASLTLALPGFAAEGSIRLGSVEITPGKFTTFEAPLSPAQQAFAQAGGNPRALTAKCAIIVPPGFDPAKRWPILIESAPQGFPTVDGMRVFGEPAATAGWVTLAAEGPVPPAVETIEWYTAMLEAAFDTMEKSWPGARRWPVACGGFSGGAKRSAYVGAMLMKGGHPVIGLWMGGCNENCASDALRRYAPGAAFQATPIFLSSGLADPIATPAQHAAVRNAMQAAGFRNVRLETYAGTHWMDAAQIVAGLRWFVSQAGIK